jgi:hypothetical protein
MRQLSKLNGWKAPSGTLLIFLDPPRKPYLGKVDNGIFISFSSPPRLWEIQEWEMYYSVTESEAVLWKLENA